MAKLSELFEKMIGLPKDGNYEIVDTSSIIEPTSTNDSENKNTNNDSNISNNTQTNDTKTNENKMYTQEEYNKLLAQITTLQTANQKLINQTTVTEKPKTVEEMIYDLCVGGKK